MNCSKNQLSKHEAEDIYWMTRKKQERRLMDRKKNYRNQIRKDSKKRITFTKKMIG